MLIGINIVALLIIIAVICFIAIKLKSRFAFNDKQFAQVNNYLNSINAFYIEVVNNKLNEISFEIQNSIYLGQLGFKYPLFLGGWSIDSFLAKYLVQQMVAQKPKTVLELGSGASTVLMARCMQIINNSYEHFAVDHEKKYLELTKQYAILNGVVEHITFWECPIQPTEEVKMLWYGGLLEKLQGKKIDLLLIDGPPGPLQKESRYPALPLLYPYLSENCTVILDDANRTDERSIIERWLKEYPEFDLVHEGSGHGIGVLTRNKLSL